jgi:purine-nucleoside phosphorylase
MSAPSGLDAAVEAACKELEKRAALAPEVLLFLATGAGLLPAKLANPTRVALGKLPGVPEVWHAGVLHAGMLGTAHAWIIEDAPGPASEGALERLGDPPWVAAFPIWLAAACGASVLVHTSAGTALDAPGAGVPGTLAVVRDHLNLSGATPLLGLGESKLGPLFPDQTRLHHDGLRKAALRQGKRLGIQIASQIAACTLGPALETPAERSYFARAGAQIAVQSLATPLIAGAHAGLGILALVALTDAGDPAGDVGSIVARAELLSPALDDLIVALSKDLARAARELGVEE